MTEDLNPPAPQDDSNSTFKVSRSRIILYAVVYVLVFALFLWSRNGATTHVKIEIRGNHYTLFLDGHEALSEPLNAWDSGGIGYLQYRKTVPIIPQYQSIANIVVTDLDTGQVLFTENFKEPEINKETWHLQQGKWEVVDGGLTSKDEEAALFTIHPWRNYSFEADVHNMIGAQFYFRAQDHRNYVGCFMRPFRDFDGNFFIFKNGRKIHQTRVKQPLSAPTESAKRSLNLVLNYLPHFVLGFLLSSLLMAALIHLFHRLYRYGSRFITLTIKDTPWKPPISEKRFFDVLTAVFCIGAFFWLLHVTSAYLDKIPHVQDSATMVFQAKTLASGRLWAPEPVSPDSFTLSWPFLYFRDGKMYGQYPLAHPLFLALGALIHRVWFMPGLSGALLLFATYLIGRELLSAKWGFLASVLLFCSPFFQMSAPNFMSHTTGSLYLALSFYFLIRTERATRLHLHPLLSGVFLGLLFHTRPLTCAAACASYGLFMLFTFVSSKSKKRLLLKYLVLLAGFVLFLAFFFLYNYLLTGDPLKSPYDAGANKVLQALDWARVAKAFLDNFTLASLFLMVVLGWSGFATTLCLFGVLLPDDRPKRLLFLLISSILFVFLAYMLYSISSVTVMYGPRYVFEIAFLYMLAVAWGVRAMVQVLPGAAQYCAQRIGGKGKWIDPLEERLVPALLRCLLVTLVFLILIFTAAHRFSTWTSKSSQPWPGNAYVPQNLHDLKGFNYTSPVVQNLAKEHDITNALIFVEGPRLQWWHYGSVFPENTPTFDGDIVYAKDLGPAVNRRVIVQYPGRKYYLANYHSKWIKEMNAEGSTSF